MSQILRRSKTKEKSKISPQYDVADLDPADLDIRQTRHTQYPAVPPTTGGTWKQIVIKTKIRVPYFHKYYPRNEYR